MKPFQSSPESTAARSDVRAVRMTVSPVTLREAHAFIAEHHRHHDPAQGGIFAIACSTDPHRVEIGPWYEQRIVGVVVVGRPVARMLQDGFSAEVTRLASDGTPNTCSLLYAAAWRAAKAMGYLRLITYILETEPGTSLDAAGWKCIGEAGGGSWSREDRPRIDTHPTQGKIRWELVA